MRLGRVHWRGLRGLLDSRCGNVATSFALTLIPLMTMIGLSLDFSRSEGASRNVQYALDGSALAAAKEMQSTKDQEKIETAAQVFFDASTSANAVSAKCDPVKVKIKEDSHGIEASVRCVQPTTLSGLVGISQIAFTRTAHTDYGVGKLDVVFMFDTSGSMGNDGRMSDLKKAANDAIETILASEVEKEGDVRIAISTYATSVNVGEIYFKAVTDQEPNLTECSKWKKKKGKKTCKKWKKVTSTCVTGREGTQKYTDAAPGSGAWISYETTDCNSATLTPLTYDETTLKNAVSALPTSGSTAGHLGIIWSWYLISPKWNSVWPSGSDAFPYDEPDLTKVAILMTDGAFNNDYMSNGDSFAHAKKYCDAMKAEGVVIYTVAFKAPQSGKDILEYCASNAGSAFAASDGQQLADAYQTIATSVSDLRISH